MQVLIWMILAIIVSGCTVINAIAPKVAPDGNTEFYLSPIEPKIVTNINLGIIRYLKWQGVETFESLLICPKGVPSEGEVSWCLQMYGGVKIDGSDAMWRHGIGDMRWGYVYIPKEQSAIRLHNVPGGISVYNMGGE